MGYVSNPGGGGGGESVPSLEPDSRLYTDDPTAFPDGICTMLASEDEAPGSFYSNWDAGIVTTVRARWPDAPTTNKDVATQVLEGIVTDAAYRVWLRADEEWSEFSFTITESNIGDFLNVLQASGEDAREEAWNVSDFPNNFTLTPVTGAMNFGPNTGEAGLVETFSDGVNGMQTFTQYSDGHKFSRGSLAGTWSSWVALQ